MNLAVVAFFTDNVASITDFYCRFLGVDPENRCAFMREDIDKTCEQLVEQGLTFEIPPRDFYWGRSAYLRDLDGHQIEIMRTEQSYAG